LDDGRTTRISVFLKHQFRYNKMAKGGKRAAKRGGRKPQKRRAKRTVAELASLSVTRAFSLLTTNQTYRLYDVQLSQFARAVNVAKGYQLYRIKNVKIMASPLADTFAPGSGTSIPYLYFQVDRTRNLDNIRTATEFKQLGCKPHRMDDKIVTFQYRPSVLNPTLDVAAPVASVFNQYKISPWLRCQDEAGAPGVWNPDTTDHQGIVMLMENAGGADVAWKIEVVVEFEFKKPSYPTTITETLPEPLELSSLALEVGA